VANTAALEERAVARFRSGLNCAQSSLLALSEEWGHQVDARVASCFGGGIGRTGAHCGILTGCLMALGLLIGTADGSDTERKESAFVLTRRFMGAFEEMAGALNCRDLIGLDPSTPEGLSNYKGRNTLDTVCIPLMNKAMALVTDFVETEGLARRASLTRPAPPSTTACY
jgi:C_GCAxxG_C_C family probable redox protein